MKIARVFPRRTNATPDDALAFTSAPGLFPPDVDAVYVSATFTWDLERAQQLAWEWQDVAPVTLGGPAIGMRGEEFRPGQFLREGYVITSRGCPNTCWFCSVWKRDGVVRELPITEGWNVLDDNLLACSYGHICNIIDMLKRQKRRPEFTGGIEAARLEPWSAEAIRSVMPKQVFLAYDGPEDWEPLVRAAELLWKVGFTPQAHRIRAYVLCGYPKDSMTSAEVRMGGVLNLGIIPMAMLWRDERGKTSVDWRRFQRRWARPALTVANTERRAS